jgi:hypothetical protein
MTIEGERNIHTDLVRSQIAHWRYRIEYQNYRLPEYEGKLSYQGAVASAIPQANGDSVKSQGVALEGHFWWSLAGVKATMNSHCRQMPRNFGIGLSPNTTKPRTLGYGSAKNPAADFSCAPSPL